LRGGMEEKQREGRGLLRVERHRERDELDAGGRHVNMRRRLLARHEVARDGDTARASNENAHEGSPREGRALTVGWHAS
jgi:hypothetical protein